jgi:hypothetical protein
MHIHDLNSSYRAIAKYWFVHIICCDRLHNCNSEDNGFGWLQLRNWCQKECVLPSRLVVHIYARAHTHFYSNNLYSHVRCNYFFVSALLSGCSSYFTLRWIPKSIPGNYQSDLVMLAYFVSALLQYFILCMSFPSLLSQDF